MFRFSSLDHRIEREFPLHPEEWKISEPYLSGRERLLEIMRTTKPLDYTKKDPLDQFLLDTLVEQADPDNVSVELFLNETKWEILPHPHIQGEIEDRHRPQTSWLMGGIYSRRLIKRLTLQERQAMLKAAFGSVYKLKQHQLAQAQEQPEESTLSPLELEDTIDELKRSYVRWMKWAGAA